MRGILKTLWLTMRPASAVAAGLVVAALALVAYLYFTRDHSQEPPSSGQATQPSVAESQPAAQEEMSAPDVEKESPDTPEPDSQPVADAVVVSIQQKIDAARANLTATPADLEVAAVHLEEAEELARAARLAANWTDLPTASALRTRIEQHRSSLREATQMAREHFDVDTVERKLGKATQAWDHPRVEECRRRIEGIVLERVALAQSRQEYEEAIGLADRLWRFSGAESHQELLQQLEESRAATTRPGAVDVEASSRGLVTKVRLIVERHDFQRQPPARIARPVRQALDAALEYLDEAARLNPSEPEITALHALLEPWSRAAQSAPNLLLSSVPDNVGLVGLFNLERLREWPALPDLVSDWLDGSHVTGNTRTVAAFFQSLGLRHLGVGTHACFASGFERCISLTESGQTDEVWASWCTLATHVRWEELLRTLATLETVEAKRVCGDPVSLNHYFSARGSDILAEPRLVFQGYAGSLRLSVLWEDEPTGHVVIADESGDLRMILFPDSLWLHQASPEFISFGLGPLPSVLLEPANEAENATSVSPVWETADPANRHEDIWLAAHRLPPGLREWLATQGLESIDGILLTAHNGSEGITLRGRLHCPNAEDAARVSESLTSIVTAPSEASSDASETASIVAELFTRFYTYTDDNVVSCRLTVAHARLDRLVEAIRREVLSPAEAKHRGP